MLPQFPALHANWQQELARHSCAIIFCWAVWSPTDIQFSSVLERVVPQCEKCPFFTANLDEEVLWPLFAEAAVTTNPCLLLWQGGTVVERAVGYMNDEQMQAKFKQWGVL